MKKIKTKKWLFVFSISTLPLVFIANSCAYQTKKDTDDSQEKIKTPNVVKKENNNKSPENKNNNVVKTNEQPNNSTQSNQNSVNNKTDQDTKKHNEVDQNLNKQSTPEKKQTNPRPSTNINQVQSKHKTESSPKQQEIKQETKKTENPVNVNKSNQSQSSTKTEEQSKVDSQTKTEQQSQPSPKTEIKEQKQEIVPNQTKQNDLSQNQVSENNLHSQNPNNIPFIPVKDTAYIRKSSHIGANFDKNPLNIVNENNFNNNSVSTEYAQLLANNNYLNYPHQKFNPIVPNITEVAFNEAIFGANSIDLYFSIKGPYNKYVLEYEDTTNNNTTTKTIDLLKTNKNIFKTTIQTGREFKKLKLKNIKNNQNTIFSFSDESKYTINAQTLNTSTIYFFRVTDHFRKNISNNTLNISFDLEEQSDYFPLETFRFSNTLFKKW
ncbi:hypothetical protein [Mycoplasma miroungirhinis]|uniref:Lipoprotein n=1 Tax=Mycoplasma miroungirhinis TaxID=754516 RepID=A0A6M4JDA1_9MOLU|nr:hypothetical protein [Mycoplasma miroungirhinis]QJR44057.1 hypothetical protein HLA92_01220 [Mycoplasma miroungirhinis]